MSRRLNLFPTPLIIDELKDARALNAQLEQAILERMTADPGIKRSNAGGWHSATDLLKWGCSAATRIGKHALRLATANTTTSRGAELRWSIVAWANVNGPGEPFVAAQL
jgi:hypothetical protein